MHLSHHKLHPHHIYQLEVVFLFAAGVFLFFPYWMIIKEYHKDLAVWQWYFLLPYLAFYTVYSLRQRARIPKEERISPLRRPIGHWVLFGLVLLFYHLQPLDLERMYGIDILFAVFTIFLADGSWDFGHGYDRTDNTDT